jgi:hypothetical protein
MTVQKKGFDPLSNLFSGGGPGPALPDVEDAGSPPDEAPDPAHLRRRPPAPPGATTAAAAPAAPAPRPGPDPAVLARLIAKAAVAKAGGAARTRPAPARPAARATEPPATERPAASRLAAAPPPKRALSMEEALAAARTPEPEAPRAEPTPPPRAAAAAAEAVRPARPAPRAPAVPDFVEAAGEDLGDRALAVLRAELTGLGAVYVANALLMDDRGVLKALWKAHRARFTSAGELDRALAASRVLEAIVRVPVGALAAVHAVTDRTDFLVWIDTDARVAIAAFPDPRSLLASG